MALIQHTVEKLNATNYVNWSADLKYVLLEKNAWNIVNGTESRPEATTASADAKDFDARARTALSLIYLNVGIDFRKIIEDYDDPKQAWDKLKTHYQPDNRARHMMLFTELCSCYIDRNESVDLFAARIKRVSEQLNAIKRPIDEIFLSFQLIRHLPATFDGIVQSILRWKEAEFTFEKILVELVAEESRLKLRDQDKEHGYDIQAQMTQLNFNHTNPRRQLSTTSPLPNVASASPRSQFRPSRPQFQRQSRYDVHRSSSPYQQNQRQLSPYRQQNSQYPDYKPYSGQTNQQRGQSSFRRSRSNGFKRPFNQYRSRRGQYSCKSNTFHVSFLTQKCLNNTEETENSWVYDTAASHHFCNDKGLFVKFTPLEHETMAVAIGGISFPVLGTGVIRLKFGKQLLYFKDVKYTPKLRRNLISGPKLDKGGITLKGGNGIIKFFHETEPIFNAYLKEDVYHLYPKIPSKSNKRVHFEALAVDINKMTIWHKRLAHASPSIIENTYSKNCVNGLPNLKDKNFHCEICKLNKFKRVSFKPQRNIRSKHAADLLYMDVWGPCRVKGRKGERYFLSIVDDYSRKTSVYPMRFKTEVFDIVKQHIARAERYLNYKVKAIRSDNGTEFKNDNFTKFCSEKGINHEFTNIFTPEQNGPCERYNQTVLNGARSILSESGLHQYFWPEAVIYFTYTWNRLCHGNLMKTPCELYAGNKPSVRHLKPFGSTAYLGIPRQHRSKLEAKAVKGVMVGYAFNTRGYRIWIPETDKIVESINVSFKEDTPYQKKRNGAVMGPDDDNVFYYIISDQPSQSNESENEENENSESTSSQKVKTPELSSDSEEDVDESNDKLINVTWTRKVSRRKDRSRSDIYYYEKGKSF